MNLHNLAIHAYKHHSAKYNIFLKEVNLANFKLFANSFHSYPADDTDPSSSDDPIVWSPSCDFQKRKVECSSLHRLKAFFYHSIKTPRSVLTNEAIAELFKPTSRCFEIVVKKFLQQSFSNESVFQEKTEVKVGLIYGRSLPRHLNTTRF